MSDFDFGDALEDAIENRQNTAGFIFAQGAANQRAAQLRALEKQLAVDNKRARTEEERLSVEKRRLRIEAERLAVEKEAKSSAEEQANEIRFLRGVMVDMGADLAVIKKAISTMVSGRKDQAITLRVAYVQVLLKLIGDRSHVLSDLGDLKEFQRLGAEFTEVSRECHQKGLSPEDPLQRVVNEIESLDQWGVEAKTLLDRGRWLLSYELFREGSFRAGLPRMAEVSAELEDFIQTVDGDVERISRQLPLFCFVGPSLNSSIGVIWELLHENRPASEWFNPLSQSREELGQTREWAEKARAQLSQIERLGAHALADNDTLRAALQELERGNPQNARMLSARPVSERFNDPQWEQLAVRLQKMDTEYAAVYAVVIKGWDPLEMGRTIRSLNESMLWANVDPQSEWGSALTTLKLRARRYRLTAAIVPPLVLVALLVVVIVYQSNQELSAAMKKAEIKLEAEAAERAQRAEEKAAEAEIENEKIAKAKEEDERIARQKASEERRIQEKAQQLQTLKASAEQGSATAQFELGKMYFEGQDVEKDEDKAFDLLEKAVFNKNEQALDYLILLADRGRARDQVRLGMIYAEGKGVEKDYKKAVEWIRKAADQGDDDAKMVLGSFYFRGHGVLTDHIEAYKWFLSAGDKGKKITAEIEELLTAEQVVIWRRRLGPDFLRSKR